MIKITNTLKHVAITAIFSAASGLFGAYLVYHSNESEKARQTASLEACYSKVDLICRGTELGPIRVTSIMCNEKREMCICGDPEEIMNQQPPALNNIGCTREKCQ